MFAYGPRITKEPGNGRLWAIWSWLRGRLVVASGLYVPESLTGLWLLRGHLVHGRLEAIWTLVA